MFNLSNKGKEKGPQATLGKSGITRQERNPNGILIWMDRLGLDCLWTAL